MPMSEPPLSPVKYKSVSLNPIGVSVSAMLRKTKLNSPLALPENFVPTATSVLCHRGGKEVFNHKGNIRFRQVMENYRSRYHRETSRAEKSLVVIDVVDEIRARHLKETGTLEGAFVKLSDDGRWVDVGDIVARRKVGQAIRLVIRSKKAGEVQKQKELAIQGAAEPLDSEPIPLSVIIADQVEPWQQYDSWTSSSSCSIDQDGPPSPTVDCEDWLPIKAEGEETHQWSNETIDLLQNALLEDM